MTVHEIDDLPKADFTVIGDPIAHSKSPAMHAAAYRALGLDLSYVAVRVSAERVGEALDRMRERGVRGVNVTVPHKEAAFAWAAQTDDFSQRVRAVNTLRLADRAGRNTDRDGFLFALDEIGLHGGRVLFLGAGGSARAALAALDETNRFTLAVWNRTPERAHRLVDDLRIRADVIATPDPADCDLIVNATSASLSGISLPIDWNRAKPTAWALDLAYGSEPTRFQRDAEAAGLRSSDGRPMLVGQGATSFEWWLGISPPRHVMLEAVA